MSNEHQIEFDGLRRRVVLSVGGRSDRTHFGMPHVDDVYRRGKIVDGVKNAVGFEDELPDFA
jgi:hypothetical protein